jgi:hypothetical protein
MPISRHLGVRFSDAIGTAGQFLNTTREDCRLRSDVTIAAISTSVWVTNAGFGAAPQVTCPRYPSSVE